MRRFPLAFAIAVSLSAGVAAAAPPRPIDGTNFSFPGVSPSPHSASSAGFALADRWLGEEPFDNPATGGKLAFAVSPLLLHVSRQDLRAVNREFDDQGAFIDFAGASVSLPAGPVGLVAYFTQPGLRLEANAFNLGGSTPGPPATIESNVTSRDLRAGVGVSRGFGIARLGVAAEWTKLDETYEADVTDGSPNSGTTTSTFSGTGIGGVIGGRIEATAFGRGLTLGGSVRRVPEVSVDGTTHFDLISGDTTLTIDATRSAAWEAGLSAAFAIDPTFRVIAGVGGRAAQGWDGFGVFAGPTNQWSVGGEYHDARDPWTLRFGGGVDQQTNVPESRAGVFGLGFGWSFGGAIAELGLTHRVLARAGAPHSYEERVVGTIRIR